MTVRGAVGNSPSRLPGAPDRGSVPPRPSFESRRELLDLLRRYALCVETADLLDDRARRCTSSHLAALLRQRADVRRRTAERVLAELLRQGAGVVPRRPLGPGGSARGR